jgi:hypothetical protein
MTDARFLLRRSLHGEYYLHTAYAEMPFEFSMRRAYDGHAVDTLNQQDLMALRVLNARLCWTILLLQGFMVVTCV